MWEDNQLGGSSHIIYNAGLESQMESYFFGFIILILQYFPLRPLDIALLPYAILVFQSKNLRPT